MDNNTYADFMKQFFNSIDPLIEKKPKELAKRFAEYCWGTDEYYELGG